ncbi:ABC transporter ATP-binding protein [Rhodoferax sp.]|uniref:ABC transporter ATP-binding protein n=1 Tax=Rhodoferax sp. TaxID=50421 RepID=UPI0025E6D35D|nr:ABC transporter ATP-binding protein [Rhodoferax sp.]MCM2342672.1 ABC transporter ATP-binding protein [Rhodoferax sp.]
MNGVTSISDDALNLSGVSKQYGKRGQPLLALDRIDLKVPRGQLFGLIGHNGAGKSTLFKLVLGLITPSQGHIRVNGIAVDGPDFRNARRAIGYLPENLVLYDNLSGLETLEFFAQLKGAPKNQCAPLLAQVGLEAAAGRAVREYSKGMRQRLGFAQALLGSPQLLLLDEPTTGLDPSAIRDFYDQLESLRAQGVTIVISSHVLAELQQRVDALAMLGNGRIQAQGTVAALREHSRMPIRLCVTGDATRLTELATALQRDANHAVLSTHQASPDTLEVRCAREHKMALLGLLAPAGLHDLQILEPSLEDVYFGLREEV